MTDQTSANKEKSNPPAPLPTATVVQRHGITESKFWLLTVAALLVAIGLAWWSMPPAGTKIRIRFPAGHGLHVGDAVRYRGIEVGEVHSIELDSQMESIDVHVSLKPSASGLAREGTEFWIVRPTLGIGGISGLDTAVGPKYIAVAFNGNQEEPTRRATEFQGLADEPQHGDNDSGIEIVLRADKRHSVSAGSGVTFRGVEVGRILDVGLSDDARFVDLRTRVFSPYDKLITSETRFWANSGVDIDFSLRGGLKLDSESLETIARGGVSFLTLKAGGQEAAAGQIFTLNQQAEANWFEQANQVRLPSVRLKGAVSLVIEETRNGLLGRRTTKTSATGIPIRRTDGTSGILLPASIVLKLQDRSVDQRTLSVDKTNLKMPAQPNQNLAAADRKDQADEGEPADESQLAFLQIPADTKLNWQTYPDDFPNYTIAGGLVAVRRPAGTTGNTYLHVSIAAENIVRDANGDTIINGFNGDQQLWNGSPILSEADGQIVGVLSLTKNGAKIIPNAELAKLLTD